MICQTYCNNKLMLNIIINYSIFRMDGTSFNVKIILGRVKGALSYTVHQESLILYNASALLCV